MYCALSALGPLLHPGIKGANLTAENSQDDVSIVGELTKSGLKVSARSRLVSAIDRLFGDVFDAIGSPINGWNERRKARVAGEKQIIEAAAKFGVDQLAKGDEFAARLYSNHFGKLAREQVNKDAVLEAAVEDLQSSRQEEETGAEKEKLDDTFLDRFDMYASQATTEALREKWGRVLAAEVRKPGTFSNKVLRVIDELDAETALLFERICEHRLGDVVPKCLLGKLPFSDAAALSTAGLILEPGLGQVARFAKEKARDGRQIWFVAFLTRAISLPLDVSLPNQANNDDGAVLLDGSTPASPVYVLTDVGLAISTILPDQQSTAFDAYASKLRDAIPHGQISLFRRTNGPFLHVRNLPEKAEAPGPS